MTKGAAPCAVKVACTVLNGGDEETYHKATRLVPTQLECGHVNTPPCPTRAGSRGPDQLCAGSSNSWRASIVGLFLSKSTSKESLRALPTYEERCSSSLDKKYARYITFLPGRGCSMSDKLPQTKTCDRTGKNAR